MDRVVGAARYIIPYLESTPGLQVGLGMTHTMTAPQTFKLCLAPRMERPDLHKTVEIPAGEGFKAAMLEVLQVHLVEPLGSESRARRRFQQGGTSTLMSAKRLAPQILPYVLKAGTSRGKAGLREAEGYSLLSADLDHAPVTIKGLMRITHQATSAFKAFVHTTWSCKDGDAGARVHIPLSRLVTHKEAVALWWWLRDQLRSHGLPEAQVGGAGPVVDPVFEDAQAYLLPAMPASGVVGEEGWGGTPPTGFVSDDSLPLLDVDSILKAARAVQARDVKTYRDIWPKIKPPGTRGAATKRVIGETSIVEPFDEVRFEGTDLRSWIVAHLAPGTEQLVASPWKPDGGGLHKGNCNLHHDLDGKLRAHDFTSNITHFDTANDYSSSHTKRRAGTDSVYRDPLTGLMVHMDSEDLVGGQYLDWSGIISKIKTGLKEGVRFDHKTLRAWVIEAGQGRGKSEIFSRYIQEQRALDPDRVDIIVAPTRTLAAAAATRFAVPLYSDSEGYILGSSSVCLNSLHRVPTVCARGLQRSGSSITGWDRGPVAQGVDSIIYDESEQLLSGLLGSHFDDFTAQRAYNALVEQTRNAKLVACLDANAGPLTLGLLRDAGITPDQIVWVVAPPPAPREIKIFPSIASWMGAIVEAARTGRQAVSIHSPERAEALAEVMPEFEGMPTLVLTADTILKNKYDLNDINHLLLSHGHVILNPAVGTGVSIDLKDRYERVWAYLSSSVATAQHALQLVTRVRSPINPEIYLCASQGGGSREGWERDPDQVLDRWLRAELTTAKAVGVPRLLPALLTEGDGAGGWRVLPSISQYVHHCSRAHAAQVRAGLGRAVPALLAYARQIGWTVTQDDRDRPADLEHLAEFKRAKLAVDEAAIMRVVSTPDLDEPTLKTVRAHGPTTTEEAIGLRRASIDRAYGPGSASREEVVRYDDSGRGRAHVYAYSDVKAVRLGGQAVESLRRLDEGQLTRGVTAPRLRHRLVRARTLSHLISKALPVDVLADSVVEPVVDLPTITVDHDHAKTFVEYLQSPEGVKVCRHAGVKIRKDCDSNPISQVSAVLGMVGIKLKACSQRDPDDKTMITRTYSVDVEALQELHARSRYYLGRLVSGDILSEEGVTTKDASMTHEDDRPSPVVTTEREITVDEYVEREVESTWEWVFRDVLHYRTMIFPGITKIVLCHDQEAPCAVQTWVDADPDHRFVTTVQEEGRENTTMVLGWSPTIQVAPRVNTSIPGMSALKAAFTVTREQTLPSDWSEWLPTVGESYPSIKNLFESRFDVKGVMREAA